MLNRRVARLPRHEAEHDYPQYEAILAQVAVHTLGERGQKTGSRKREKTGENGRKREKTGSGVVD